MSGKPGSAPMPGLARGRGTNQRGVRGNRGRGASSPNAGFRAPTSPTRGQPVTPLSPGIHRVRGTSSPGTTRIKGPRGSPRGRGGRGATRGNRGSLPANRAAKNSPRGGRARTPKHITNRPTETRKRSNTSDVTKPATPPAFMGPASTNITHKSSISPVKSKEEPINTQNRQTDSNTKFSLQLSLDTNTRSLSDDDTIDNDFLTEKRQSTAMLALLSPRAKCSTNQPAPASNQNGTRIGLQIKSPSVPWDQQGPQNRTTRNKTQPEASIAPLVSTNPIHPLTSPPTSTINNTKETIPIIPSTKEPAKQKKKTNAPPKKKQAAPRKAKKKQPEVQSGNTESKIVAQWMAKPDNPSTQVFGIPLADAVERGPPDAISLKLPAVVLKTSFKIREHMKDEGIFRLSGGHARIQYWKKRFDLGDDPNLDDEPDPHVISGLLKLYLRELPESVLTNKLAANFEASKSIADPKVKPLYIKSLVDQLPAENYALLNWLTVLLLNIISYEELNFMGVENISLIFSPTLKCSVVVVQTILENFTIIFDRVV